MSESETNAVCEEGPVGTSCLLPINKDGLADLIKKG